MRIYRVETMGSVLSFSDKKRLFLFLKNHGMFNKGQKYMEVKVRALKPVDFNLSEYIIEQIEEDLALITGVSDGLATCEVSKESRDELDSIVQAWIKKNLSLDKYLVNDSQVERVEVTGEDLLEFNP